MLIAKIKKLKKKQIKVDFKTNGFSLYSLKEDN